MNSKILLTKEVEKTISQHAIDYFPNECCGFLYGTEEEARKIELAVPAVNSKKGDQRRRFEISPIDYMKAEQYALENNILLLGIYHSHPNHPAIASEHDLAKAMPYFSYVIVSVYDDLIKDLKSWKLKDEEAVFNEEAVIISNPVKI